MRQKLVILEILFRSSQYGCRRSLSYKHWTTLCDLEIVALSLGFLCVRFMYVSKVHRDTGLFKVQQ